jgi:hypothetical protein
MSYRIFIIVAYGYVSDHHPLNHTAPLSPPDVSHPRCIPQSHRRILTSPIIPPRRHLSNHTAASSPPHQLNRHMIASAPIKPPHHTIPTDQIIVTAAISDQGHLSSAVC